MANQSSAGAAQVFRIEGARIDTIDDFYAQLNELLMQGETWQLGASLDALNDVLYRFSPSDGAGQAVFVWADHEHSREALGLTTTRRWLEGKLEQPGSFNSRAIREQLAALLAGEGQTYFEIVEAVFFEHAPHVRLELA